MSARAEAMATAISNRAAKRASAVKGDTVTVTLPTLNGQTITVVRDASTGAVTVRIAKDGHNRGIAKLDAFSGDQLGRFLAPLEWPNPV